MSSEHNWRIEFVNQTLWPNFCILFDGPVISAYGSFAMCEAIKNGTQKQWHTQPAANARAPEAPVIRKRTPIARSA